MLIIEQRKTEPTASPANEIHDPKLKLLCADHGAGGTTTAVHALNYAHARHWEVLILTDNVDNTTRVTLWVL